MRDPPVGPVRGNDDGDDDGSNDDNDETDGADTDVDGSDVEVQVEHDYADSHDTTNTSTDSHNDDFTDETNNNQDGSDSTLSSSPAPASPNPNSPAGAAWPAWSMVPSSFGSQLGQNGVVQQQQASLFFNVLKYFPAWILCPSYLYIIFENVAGKGNVLLVFLGTEYHDRHRRTIRASRRCPQPGHLPSRARGGRGG